MQLLVAFQDNAFMDTDIYIYIYILNGLVVTFLSRYCIKPSLEFSFINTL